ncbi:hypothetical protein KM043_004528 [Ampulex compressa]|nr:hypothetical protein KM043_004528 [Ampulex compressa]
MADNLLEESAAGFSPSSSINDLPNSLTAPGTTSGDIAVPPPIGAVTHTTYLQIPTRYRLRARHTPPRKSKGFPRVRVECLVSLGRPPSPGQEGASLPDRMAYTLALPGTASFVLAAENGALCFERGKQLPSLRQRARREE